MCACIMSTHAWLQLVLPCRYDCAMQCTNWCNDVLCHAWLQLECNRYLHAIGGHVDMIAQCDVQFDAMRCYAMLDYNWSAINTLHAMLQSCLCGTSWHSRITQGGSWYWLWQTFSECCFDIPAIVLLICLADLACFLMWYPAFWHMITLVFCTILWNTLKESSIWHPWSNGFSNM